MLLYKLTTLKEYAKMVSLKKEKLKMLGFGLNCAMKTLEEKYCHL
jgi:hypothetical protein